MYDLGDILLFALSARRQIKWGTFKRYFDEVYRRSTVTRQGEADRSAARHRSRVLRGLGCLGHIDWRSGTGELEIVAAPPTLASLPVLMSCCAILCGARSPSTVEELTRTARGAGVNVVVNSQTGTNPYAPARVELLAEDTSAMQEVADSVGLRFMEVPPARVLAQGSTSLAEYTRGLTWSSERELNWPRQDFQEDSGGFRGVREPSSSWRLSQYQNPVTSARHYRLWQDGKSAEVDLDWGRYVIARQSSMSYLRYVPEKRNALVPVGALLPPLLARAFGLCSGRWPALAEYPGAGPFRRWYQFSDVPPSVFNIIAKKLGS